MKQGLGRATEILTKYRNYLNTIAQKLVKDETLEQEQFYEIVKEIIPAEKVENQKAELAAAEAVEKVSN
jgi:ATP-dependent Zn protease